MSGTMQGGAGGAGGAPGKGGMGPGPQVPQGSVMDKSSWAYNQALNQANAMGQMSAMGGNYGAGRARQSAGPQGAYKQMGNYQNPYEQQVVNRTARDMQRQGQVAQRQNAAAASQAGAFGGGRHGVTEALTNAEVNRNIGDMSAGLRQQGFNTALGAAQQDIANRTANRQFNVGQANAMKQFNAGQRLAGDQFRAGNMQNAASLMSGLAGQGFDFGNTLNAQQMQAGNQQQQLMQQVLSGGAEQFDQYMQSPYKALQAMTAGIHGNPLSAATTSSSTSSTNPGLLGALGFAGQAAGLGKGGK